MMTGLRNIMPKTSRALLRGPSSPLDASSVSKSVMPASAGRREILLESLAAHDLSPATTQNWDTFVEEGEHFAIATAPIDRGLYFGAGKPTLLCEALEYSWSEAKFNHGSLKWHHGSLQPTSVRSFSEN